MLLQINHAEISKTGIAILWLILSRFICVMNVMHFRISELVSLGLLYFWCVRDALIQMLRLK